MGVLESFSLAGKVAVVGGAGLWRQIVAALAEAGAKTFIAARDLAKLEAVATEERARGFDVTARRSTCR
jgi:NADP-dependent 3-hydroxy acid dehydrogenase YdfG